MTVEGENALLVFGRPLQKYERADALAGLVSLDRRHRRCGERAATFIFGEPRDANRIGYRAGPFGGIVSPVTRAGRSLRNALKATLPPHVVVRSRACTTAELVLTRTPPVNWVASVGDREALGRRLRGEHVGVGRAGDRERQSDDLQCLRSRRLVRS